LGGLGLFCKRKRLCGLCAVGSGVREGTGHPFAHSWAGGVCCGGFGGVFFLVLSGETSAVGFLCHILEAGKVVCASRGGRWLGVSFKGWKGSIILVGGVGVLWGGTCGSWFVVCQWVRLCMLLGDENCVCPGGLVKVAGENRLSRRGAFCGKKWGEWVVVLGLEAGGGRCDLLWKGVWRRDVVGVEFAQVVKGGVLLGLGCAKVGGYLDWSEWTGSVGGKGVSLVCWGWGVGFWVFWCFSMV